MEVPRNQGRKSGKHQKAPPEGWPAPGRLLPLALSAIILLGIGPARQALAWGRMGHRASTRLAETRLTPKAAHSSGNCSSLASRWPMPRPGPMRTVRAFQVARPGITSTCRSRPRVIRRAIATTTASSPGSRSSAGSLPIPTPRNRGGGWLCYVVHLVEDAHQPMHVGDRHDRGGNNLELQFFRDDYTNLHQVWDSGLLRNGYRNECELVDDLIDLASKPEARLDQGPNRGLGQREPGSGPPGLSHSRIERFASLRHANRPRVRGRQFASGREAALPGGDEALGGLERLPFTRGKEGDPRPHFHKEQQPAPAAAPPAPAIR